MDTYEYKVISGGPTKKAGWDVLEQELNSLVQDKWEVYQISACPSGGFGFGMGMGSGGGGGGIGPSVVMLLRRPRS
jgi:hypothetical protein